MKMKYDESDNALVRATRAVTDKVTDLIGTCSFLLPHQVIMKTALPVLNSVLFCFTACVGGLFSKTEMSEVLTEILTSDPSFDKDLFLRQCERDIIPNILEVRRTSFFNLIPVEISSSGLQVFVLMISLQYVLQ